MFSRRSRSPSPLVLLLTCCVLTTLLGAHAPARETSRAGVPAPNWRAEPGRHPGRLLPSEGALPHRPRPASGSRAASETSGNGAASETSGERAASEASGSRAASEQPPRGATYFAPAAPRRLAPGGRTRVRVTVTDSAQQAWPARDIALGVRWYRADGTEYAYGKGERPVDRLTALPEDLAPGESAELRAVVRAPDLPRTRGSLFLTWDLYDRAARRWLSEAEPPAGPVPQARERVVVERAGSDRLGLERFYQYTRAEAGAGAAVAVNAANGNAATSWNLFAHPSLGPAAFLRLTHNTQDASDTVAGPGWSLSASTLTRLGSPLHFETGQNIGIGFPDSVRMIDGDGTSHTFRLDRHGSDNPRDWDYAHPAGVHFHLQRSSGPPDRRWVFTRPDRTQFHFSAEGRRWTFGVDGHGNVVSVTDPRGNTGGDAAPKAQGPRKAPYTSYSVYDKRGRLLESTDPRGHSTRFAEYGPTGQPARVTDALGHTTRFRYDAVGAVTAVTDAKGRTSSYEYDLLGRPLGAVLPRDLAAEDPEDRWVRVPAPAYDGNDNVVRATDPNGAVTRAAYNAADRPVSVVDPPNSDDGGPERTTRYSYDKVGNRIAETTPRGHRTVFAYDELHRLIETTDPLKGRTTYVYDRAGDVLSVTRPRSNDRRARVPDQRFTYDLAHRITAVTDAEGNTVRNGYDRDGNLVSVTDQCGATTETTLDAAGAPVQIRAPHRLGDERRFECACPPGRKCELPEERIEYRITRYEYDEAGNRTKIFTPRSVAENKKTLAQETVYDPLNRVAEQILPYDPDDPGLPKPHRVRHVYDEVGDLTEVHNPPSGSSDRPSVTRYTYFDDGLLRRSTDPWQIRTDYAYDKVGNQLSRTLTGDGGGTRRTMSWRYHPDGSLAEHRDTGTPAGRETVLLDNSDAGRTEAAGQWAEEQSGSDGFGADFRTHPAEDRAASFTWRLAAPSDGTYRVLARWPRHEKGGRAEFAVPHEGGRAAVPVDQGEGSGQWRELGRFRFEAGKEYGVAVSGAEDAPGKLVLADAVELVKVEETREGREDAREYHYAYDPDGLVTRITEGAPSSPSRTWEVGNDPLGRPSAVEERDGGGGPPRRATFAYDPDGNLLEHRVTAAGRDPESSRYTYNTLGLVEEALTEGPSTDGEAKKTTFTWWPTGRLKRQTKDNGNTVDHWHYLDGALSVQEEKKEGGWELVSRHEIDYDPDGNRTRDASVKMDADDHGDTLDTVATYRYDARNRSIEVKKTGEGPDRTETYRYDPNNNVVQQRIGETETTFDYDRDRLLSSTSAGAKSSYLYDVYGRLSQVTAGGKPAQQNVYDGFDRLIETRSGSGRAQVVAEHEYDAFDRRTSTSVSGGGERRATDFHYLGLGGQLLSEEKDGKLSRTYQYGPAGERLSQVTFDTEGTKDPETVFFGYGPHNDVEHITDDKGDTKATYGYTAYGQADKAAFTGVDKPSALDPTSEPFNFYRFNSRRWDGGSGTYDMGFRDYNPGLNQFLSRDMYNGALADLDLATDPWTQNRYGFAGGNPISNVELDGHLFGMSWSELAHSVLDVAGMIPGVGEIADVANGLLYLAEGNYVEAGLSLASAIPVAGNAIGAARIARKAGKQVDEALDGGAALNKAERTESAVPDAPAPPKEKVPEPAPQPKGCPSPSSFVPGTRVLMADGTTKPIEEIRKGDRVLAANPDDSEPRPREVTRPITSKGEKKLVRVTVTNKDTRKSSLTATENHPFWVRNTGKWTKATDLRPGQWLRTSAGTYVQVETVEKSTRKTRVHNLSVADLRTYFVLAGETPVLVHNANCPNPGTKFDVPNEAGVYTIHLNDGTKYVGSSVDSMRTRVNKSMRSKHAVRKAGYSADDVVNVTWIPLPSGIGAVGARRVEQTVMDGLTSQGVRLLNRRNPEIELPIGGYLP
ncbi:polymorphic toxin-type HINT domain-containing protein [Streptomyces sp. GXMU-J15]|uniref:Polymorphic toxin-type HINT domain-containing protein n=1 Tax=Streptomyces fuscus TaxID=3048495 RepID=A0ABT7J8S0_9ACTN|nr:polymorphic toxin-type HINT domain-containing protein [Streptomyces fuscus]MDL2081280.1 polymorphic toxin-type HINT domain-containing protein [Streptomyces fuscus]